ncbi:MAG: hypothetical protein ABL995_14410 [Bryobacteraceae bacterium]
MASDPRQIVDLSISATLRHWEARLRYTYLQREESRRKDLAGHIKSEDVELSRRILVNGIPFEQLVERNGKPPAAEDERKQREKLDRLKRETPQERAEQLRKQEEENAAIIEEVPKAFNFELVGEETVSGRPAYVLRATPRPGYQPRGKYGKMFPKVEGKLWVDKEDHAWIKADGQVIQPISLGLFLARVLRGSQLTMEQTRIGEGVWMPERVVVRAVARIFLVKSLVVEQILTYSEYKLP